MCIYVIVYFYEIVGIWRQYLDAIILPAKIRICCFPRTPKT